MPGRMHCRRSAEIIRKCKLVLLLRLMRLKSSSITVEKSAYRQLSQNVTLRLDQNDSVSPGST
jgi:hypothetical protein